MNFVSGVLPVGSDRKPDHAEAYLQGNIISIGDETIVLEDQEHSVVDALVKLRAANLKTLCTKSGYKHPATVIKRLLKKYPVLQEKNLISTPKTRGTPTRGRGGYQTTIQSVE